MRLDQEQKDSIGARLRKNLKEDDSCSACGKSKWLVDDTVYGLLELMEDELVAREGIGIIPLLTSTCHNCGLVRFFNTHYLGVEFSGLIRDESGRPGIEYCSLWLARKDLRRSNLPIQAQAISWEIW